VAENLDGVQATAVGIGLACAMHVARVLADVSARRVDCVAAVCRGSIIIDRTK